jgi:DNA-binding transcriptional regulator PaaX
MTFTEKYPAATQEVLHFPLMFSDSLGPLRVGGLKYATLDLLYDFAAYFGIQAGTVRTNLSRMKKAGAVIARRKKNTATATFAPLEVMAQRTKRKT